MQRITPSCAGYCRPSLCAPRPSLPASRKRPTPSSRSRWSSPLPRAAARTSSPVRWLFGSVEYRPIAQVTLNAGGYGEDNTLSASTFSASRRGQPAGCAGTRGSLRLLDRHTQPRHTRTAHQLVLPCGGRGPTAERVDHRLLLPKPHRSGEPDERAHSSREIGYLLNAQSIGVLSTLDVFDDHLTSLIRNERISPGSFRPTPVRFASPVSSADECSLPSGWNGFANYAYLDNRDATNILERTQSSRHSGAVGVSREFADSWQAALAYIGRSGDGHQQSAYGRTDVVLSREFVAERTRWRATIGFSASTHR